MKRSRASLLIATPGQSAPRIRPLHTYDPDSPIDLLLVILVPQPAQ
jgi:hypothetical protein